MPKKLSDADRKEILELYRTSDETSATLASRYGVSSSTISRFLKTNLSDSEYDSLIQQKRQIRILTREDMGSDDTLPSADEALNDFQDDYTEEIITASEPEVGVVNTDIWLAALNDFQDDYTEEIITASEKEVVRLNKESWENWLSADEALDDFQSDYTEEVITASEKEVLNQGKDSEIDEDDFQQLDLFQGNSVLSLEFSLDATDETVEPSASEKEVTRINLGKISEQERNEPVHSVGQQLDFLDAKSMLTEDFSFDEDYSEDVDEEDTEDEEEENTVSCGSHSGDVHVLPLSQASFPKTCYIVIDRAAELITRPLKEFIDLGSIPPSEVQQKTLPVFDNQRVARRFSNRRERVIKVPDGKVLQKVCSYLQAKGITRLLIDGQVYSLF